MKKYLEILRSCPLFDNISDENLFLMLNCLGGTAHKYAKKETVIPEGSKAKYIGIVLHGSIQIEMNDYFGNRTILGTAMPSELFGESFACADIKSTPVNAVAAADSEILLIEYQRITEPCSSACGFHGQLIHNLLKIIAEKKLMFHRKIEITSKRTTREKLMAYLMNEAKKNNSRRFEISFDRQELADYLGVDRSGLSAEIGKLCKEGAISCKRNSFKLM